MISVEVASLAALHRERVARGAVLQRRATAVQRDVELRELAALGVPGDERVRAGAEESEEVAHSAVVGAGAGAVVVAFFQAGLAGGDGDARAGALEEEPGARGSVAEAAIAGVVGAQCAAHDDLRDDIRGSLPEVAPSFPCVVENLD